MATELTKYPLKKIIGGSFPSGVVSDAERRKVAMTSKKGGTRRSASKTVTSSKGTSTKVTKRK